MDALIGSWKLLSYETELQSTGERKMLFGKHPTGYMMFAPDQRMAAVITAEERQPGETGLLRTMIAYTGVYRVEDGRFITKVDASWNEIWTGTEQVRLFRLDGNSLEITSNWAPSPILPGRPITRVRICWQRVQGS